MFVRAGKVFVVVALVAMLGAHWTVLQMAAWTTMLADNLQSASFHEALVKTFDGQHPCKFCQAIAAGKKSEQKKEAAAPIQKLEFLMAEGNIVLIAPSLFQV
ncbi:MAG TPA: hypothetical protein VFC44_08760, partial [Candidatus Saccharimonadales bacterium]|nr:hypothetical protein [Candidatus Saccharimonadales bacterium]